MFVRKSYYPLQRLLRNYSNIGKSPVDVVVDNLGIATVTLQNPPVNSLDLQLVSELSNTLISLEKDKSRGLILKSFSDKVFSAGIDLLELYKPQKDRVKQFWTALQDCWINLYGFSAPTVACINGHAPAGGCLLSLSCEYRVMLKEKTIGLNETKLGLVAPPWFISTMMNVIGRRQTELALTSGRMFTTEEASKIGLIDEIAENSEEAMIKCRAFLQLFEKISPSARAATKNMIRKKTIQDLVKNKEADLNLFCDIVMQEKVQQGLGLYLQSLKKAKN
ncbi:enoyl-CoA delta isomerase 1, mitochondrial-like [Harmonia axyridis]|uniref:enoyl-CoA delta isomerase 1, mitochondrial-like n=1 Tax=Harmonia axyridis TaxID=115357 RepID=UPI001E276A21|nr:enoyl-CoA delta isomerase 1, mitochondrial-like [Harmonia axyridis]XP_045463698.1 enoyl-CoA delta isomerase 1, mitochondrial-like [Harmonia axyridis]XP_045463699.1 enoyl-CoA delta isomerase 1, mitochondrial-like [Harmonia axyridis]XP_045463700.1 enoyl-CoA delta isomerase 1, mitochondrial-like [Harmonia axyridis]